MLGWKSALILVGLMCLAAVPGLILQVRIDQLVKLKYPDMWRKLGSPGWFHRNTLENNWLMLKFVYSNQAKRLNDSSLNRLVLAKRVVDSTMLALLIFYVAGIAWSVGSPRGQ